MTDLSCEKKKYPLGWRLLLIAVLAAYPAFMSPSTAPAEMRTYDSAGALEKAGIQPMPKTAPPLDFVLPDINGRPLRLSDLRGKVVLLNFWTTWCPNCRTEMPGLERLHRHFKGRDFVLLAVNILEPAPRVKHFMDALRLTFKTLLDSDGRVSLAFAVRGIPTTFIIDKDGALIGRAIGSRTWDGPAVTALLEHYMAAPSGLPGAQAPEVKKKK